MKLVAEALVVFIILATVTFVGLASNISPLSKVPRRSDTPPYEWAIERFAPRVIEWYCMDASKSGQHKLRKEVVGDTGHYVRVLCK